MTLLVRGGDLTGTMSRYLIDRIEASEKITVEYRTEVAGALGEPAPRGPAAAVNGTDEQEVAADALFVFVGQAPRTSWLEGVVRRDDRGFVLTGTDLGIAAAGLAAGRAAAAAGDLGAGRLRRRRRPARVGEADRVRRGGGRDGGALRPRAAGAVGDRRRPASELVGGAAPARVLFAELPEDDVAALAAAQPPASSWRPARCSCAEGSPPDAMYVVTDGELEVQPAAPTAPSCC